LSEGIARHVKPVPRESNVEPTAASTVASKRKRGPTVPQAPPPQATPTGRSRSGGDGNAKSPPGTDVKTELLLPGTSPTPGPVPFGAPVRFRTDMWSLPDEPLLGFVEIPAGKFTMGSDKRQFSDDNEFPQHKVDLPRYYIGRYEVTVAQFRAFVQVSGYQSGPTQKQDGPTDLPVVDVSWHDAVAYATWLDKSLRESRTAPTSVRAILFEDGKSSRVTLPSEAEWEKAARGIDARVYPWGGKFHPAKANVGKKAKALMPVGSYPDGASPYGLLDMSGNVCEWTRSLWGTDSDKPGFGYSYDPIDPQREDLKAPDTVFRVVRGGSWLDVDHRARTAVRFRGSPSYRGDFLGFRVVVSCSRS
jgi:formylglycine-generating enzyme required for sulfatase activity